MRYCFLLVLALAFVGCGNRTLLHSYQHVNPHGWSCIDTLHFSVPPLPDDGLYTFSVGLRAADGIRHRDLWLVLEQRTDIACRDTLHLILASDDGRWQGQGNLLHAIEETACTARGKQGQEIELLLYHIMAAQEVEGITEVGVKVEY